MGLEWVRVRGLGGGSLCEKHSPGPGCPVREPPPPPRHSREPGFRFACGPSAGVPGTEQLFSSLLLTHPQGRGSGEKQHFFISSALKRDYEPFWEWIKAIAPGMDLILGDFCFPLFLDLRAESFGLLKST